MNLLKTPRDKVPRVGYLTAQLFQGDVPGEDMSLHIHFHVLYTVHLFIRTFCERYCISQIWCFPEFCEPLKQLIKPEEEVVETLIYIAGLSKAWVKQIWALHLKYRAVLGMELSTFTPVATVRPDWREDNHLLQIYWWGESSDILGLQKRPGL